MIRSKTTIAILLSTAMLSIAPVAAQPAPATAAAETPHDRLFRLFKESDEAQLKRKPLFGSFRGDLFYRLNVFTIDLPPLRERRDDIPLLVQTFLNEFNRTNNKAVRGVEQDAMYLLEHYPWPGNIRELRNVIERATILADGEFIEAKHLPPPLVTRGEESLPSLTLVPGTTVDEAERRLITLTLDHCRNNKTRAAEVLGISLKTLHNKLNRMKEAAGARS